MELRREIASSEEPAVENGEMESKTDSVPTAQAPCVLHHGGLPSRAETNVAEQLHNHSQASRTLAVPMRGLA